jgi:hypothetical protein
MNTSTSCLITALLLLYPCVATAQSSSRFEAAAQVAVANSDEFDGADTAVGGRFAWRPTSLLGAEAELNFYPGDYPDDTPFSRSRVEGLFGVTLGPRLGALRPFFRLRPGFVTFHEAPGPIACILIFPPPLQCALAAGDTVLAVDIGAGVEYFPTARTLLRVDLGDRALRFSRPSINSSGAIDEGFSFSHGLRFAAGGGVRF